MSHLAVKVSAVATGAHTLTVADLRGFMELWDAAIHEPGSDDRAPLSAAIDSRGQVMSVSAEVPSLRRDG